MMWPKDLYAPCLNEWTPRTCHVLATTPPSRIRSPIDHTCWIPRGLPHVCICGRCGNPGLPRPRVSRET
jgi:hypothetical protein